MKQKRILAWISIITMLVANIPMSLAASSSTNYILHNGQFNSTTELGSSTNYILEGGANFISGLTIDSDNSVYYSIKQGSAFTPYSPPAEEEEETPTEVSPTTGGGGISSSNGVQGDNSTPQVSGTTISNISYNSAVISFATNEDTIAYILFGRDNEYNLLTGTESTYSQDHEFTLGNLTPDTTYKFMIAVGDSYSNWGQTTAYSFHTLELTTSIPNVSNFSGLAITNGFLLTWENPDIGGFEKVQLRRSTTTYPNSPSEGTLVYEGSGEAYSDTDITKGIRYYYTIFVFDEEDNHSSGALETMYLSAETTTPSEPVIPELPEGAEPVTEDEEIDGSLIDLISLIEQGSETQYQALIDAVDQILQNAQDQFDLINNIKNGLVEQAFDIQTGIYELLTPEEKTAIEEVIGEELPPAITLEEYEKLVNSVKNLLIEKSDEISNIKNNLISQYYLIQEDVFNSLTPKEIQAIEEVIGEELPPAITIDQYEEFIGSVTDLLIEKSDELNQIKDGLFDEYLTLQEDVFESLTPAERAAIEELIGEELPETIDPKKYAELLAEIQQSLLDTPDQINQIKEGLLNEFSLIQEDVFENLSLKERLQIEALIGQQLPQTLDQETYTAIIKEIEAKFGATKDEINTIRAGLVNEFLQVQEDVYSSLTPEEIEQLEEILQEDLPSVFDPGILTNFIPITLAKDNTTGGGGEEAYDWTIIAGTETIISIPAEIIKKDVLVITVTLEKDAYVLQYNPENNAYEAIMKAPEEKGNYRLVIQIIYTDNTYEELYKGVLVDPYGYIFTKQWMGWNWLKPWELLMKEEVKIPGATVTLYSKSKTDQWDEWPAHLYNQYNPQLTNENGNFAFLTPAGEYYLHAIAPGYKQKETNAFIVEDKIVNINIELKKYSKNPFLLPLTYVIIFVALCTVFLARKRRKNKK